MTSPAPPEPPTNPAADLPEIFAVDSAPLRAEVEARTPIRFTAAGEPYIPLPSAQFQNFHLGTMRQSDVPHDVEMMSDIRVARTLVGPPFPMPIYNTQDWLARERAAVSALFAAYAQGHFVPAASDPFSILRERMEDGSETYVGQLTMHYCGDDEKRLTTINDAWEAWRTRTKIWEIGGRSSLPPLVTPLIVRMFVIVALRPEYHRRGLATAAVSLLIKAWAVPQMGATELRAQCFVSNVGSVRLWEKHGFVEVPELRGVVNVCEAKGGGVEPDCVFVWGLA